MCRFRTIRQLPEAAQGSRSFLGFSRRRMIAALAGMPLVGGFALRAQHCAAGESREQRPSTGDLDLSRELEKLKGQVPQGQIGRLKLSRLILGGNLIGGWDHART